MGGSPEKVAWITGASAGIGLATAKAVARRGFRCVLSARDAGALARACDELRGDGAAVEAIALDVAQRAQVDMAASDIRRRHGRIDLLVNNAGFNSQKRKWDELVPEEFDAVIAANLTGTFNAIHAVLPTMRRQRGGLVVSISSVAGKRVDPEGGVAYTIAKHGVHIMSQMLNQTERANGIRSCVVAPSGVSTRAHDWRPRELRAYMLEPEDVANAVCFAIDQPPHSAIHEIELAWAPA